MARALFGLAAADDVGQERADPLAQVPTVAPGLELLSNGERRAMGTRFAIGDLSFTRKLAGFAGPPVARLRYVTRTMLGGIGLRRRRAKLSGRSHGAAFPGVALP